MWRRYHAFVVTSRRLPDHQTTKRESGGVTANYAVTSKPPSEINKVQTCDRDRESGGANANYAIASKPPINLRSENEHVLDAFVLGWKVDERLETCKDKTNNKWDEQNKHFCTHLAHPRNLVSERNKREQGKMIDQSSRTRLIWSISLDSVLPPFPLLLVLLRSDTKLHSGYPPLQ